MKEAKKIFDEEIFRPEFKLDGAHLVAASAGTGKTYNIQNIYARLLLDRGYQVSQIQVMTFTEAATKELKARLHSILKDLQKRFAGEECEDNTRADKLIACVKDWAAARKQVELALLDFDNAAITTIHGFCQRVLTRYAFETGINLAMSIEDRKNADLLELANDWWRKNQKEAVGKQVKLKNLQKYVKTLGGKADYEVRIPPEAPEKAEFLTLSIAKKLVEQYEDERPQREKQSFDDLLKALRDALKNDEKGELAAKLREDFKAALIDEFQDTDPVQYDIFRRIFLEGGDNLPLFFVGDPKQAIYAFRSGDIYTYIKASKNEALQDQKYTLNKNFRSTENMIQAINAFFKDEDPQNGKYTFSNEEIDYDGTLEVGRKPDIKGPDLARPFSIITVPVENNDEGSILFPATSKKTVSGGAIKKAIMPVLINQVKLLLAEKKSDGAPCFSPKDIAILLNSHTQEAALQKALMAEGIPSVIAEAGNVFASPAAYELKAVLEAMLQPEGHKLLSGLLTVFGGVSPEKIISLQAEFANHNGQSGVSPEKTISLQGTKELADMVAKFRGLGEIWQKNGFVSLVAALEKLGYQKRLAEKEAGERMLTDMEQLLEMCIATSRNIGSSTEKLLEWLENRMYLATQKEHDNPKGESRSKDYMRELEKDGEAVKIMTIFYSKGLQFPVVLLPDCWDLTNQHDPRNQISLPCYHSKDDEKKLVFELDVNSDGNVPEKRGKAKNEALKELLQEKMRFLYVAMTRAIERMILLAPGKAQISKNEPLYSLIDRAKDISFIELLKSTEIEEAPSYNPVQRQEPQLKEAQSPAKFNLRPSKGSYTSLSPSAKENPDDDGRDNDDQDNDGKKQNKEKSELPIFNIPKGTRLGTCWHSILEKISFDATDGKLSQIAADELASSGYAAEGELLQTTVDMLRKTLDYTLTSPNGEQFQLSQIGWEQRLSEQEFDFSSATAVKKTQAIKAIIERHWKDDAEKADFLKTMGDWDRDVPNGFFNGFIDLIFQKGGFFYIVDWKSNILDSKKENFNASGIRKEMAKHGYFLQYLLYSAVLHRYLKETLGNAYSWQCNFGGVRYYFLRGIAAEGAAPVFEDRPSEALLDDLCTALGMK